jgi:O-antigen/teichoic acid export membrane protein
MDTKSQERTNRINIRVGTAISLLSLIVGILIHVLYTPFLLNTLGDAQYGISTFVNSISSWFAIIAMALSSAFVRFATIGEKRGGSDGLNKINGLFFAMFFVISILVLIAGSVILLLLMENIIPLEKYNNSEKDMIFIIMGLSLLQIAVSIPANIGTLFATYRQKFIWVRGMDFLSAILIPAITIPFLKNGKDIVWVVGISCSIQFLFILFNLLYCIFVLKMKSNFHFVKEDNATLKAIVIFSSYILISQIVDQVNANADKTILGFMAGASAVTMYQLGMQFSVYEQQMSVAVSTNYIPRITALAVDDNIKAVNEEFIKISRIQMFIVFLLVGGFSVCGKEFIVAVFGESHMEAYYIAMVLFVIGIIPNTENAGVQIQRAYNKHKFRALLYLAIAVFNISLSILLVEVMPKGMEIWGCLIGTVAATVLGTWIAMNIYNAKVIHLDVRTYFKYLARGVLVSLFPIAFVYGTSSVFNIGSMRLWIQFLIKGFMFVFLYLVTFYFFENDTCRSIFWQSKRNTFKKDH